MGFVRVGGFAVRYFAAAAIPIVTPHTNFHIGEGHEVMNKQELIDAVATATGSTKTVTGDRINAIIETIERAVAKGDIVQLIGFGSFSQAVRAARTGRNPLTGEAIAIPSKKKVKFVAGKAFKDNVNGLSGW